MSKELVQVSVPKEIYDEFKSYQNDRVARWAHDVEANAIARSLLNDEIIAPGTKIGIKFVSGDEIPNKPHARKVEIFDVVEEPDTRIVTSPKIKLILETVIKRKN